jgi:DNA-binding NtrC family response regulator
MPFPAPYAVPGGDAILDARQSAQDGFVGLCASEENSDELRFAMPEAPRKKDTKTKKPRKRAVDDIHVPEEAENFEHTIRRLTIEKQKKREKSAGLYR